MEALGLALDARKARDFGIGRYILGLLRPLVDSGAVTVTALCREGDESLFPPRVHTVPSRIRPYSLRELFLAGRPMGRMAAEVVHWPHYVVPLGTPRPAIVTIHDLMHLTEPEHASVGKRAYARMVLGHAISVSTAVITVSLHTAREIETRFPSASEKLEVIWNGIEPVFFSARASDSPVPAPYVLYCGNDKPHKNLDALFEAFSLVMEALPGLKLVLAGVPAASAPSRLLKARAARIEDRLVETGFVPDSELAALMAGAEVFVLPSVTEGFGLPVLEAMAAGAPVACSNRGSLPEVAEGAARFFNPGDRRDMAEAIRSLLLDREARQGARERGRIRAASFSWERAAEKHLAVYRRAARRSR